MNLIETCIKRPVAVTVFVLFLLFCGILSYLSTPVDLLPDISVPTIAVVTYYPNATAQNIEETVTIPLEEVLNTIEGLKEIRSVTREEESVIVLKFDWKIKLEFAIMEAREKVRLVELPQGCYTPSIQRWDVTDLPILRVDFSGGLSQRELYKLIKDKIVPRIERIPGVGNIDIYGGSEEEIQVRLLQGKLAHYGLGFHQVLEALSKQNVNRQVGEIVDGKNIYAIRILGKYNSLDDILNTVVDSHSGSIIRLRDVAFIEQVEKEQRYIARVNGEDSVAITVHKTKGGNTLEVIDRVKSELKTLKNILPQNVSINISRDDSTYIKEAQSFAFSNLWMAILCTMVVLFAFMHSIRLTAIIGLTIPVSIIATFSIIKLCGLTRNVLSLAGLALATGMIVDTSIVIIENIHRHMKFGRSLYDACISATAEVKTSVVASNLTTVAVFLPLLWTSGLANELFSDLSITVLAALAFSLIVGFLVVPTLSYKLLPEPQTLPTIQGSHYKGAKRLKQSNQQKYYEQTGRFIINIINKFGMKFSKLITNLLELLLKHNVYRVLTLFGVFLLCSLSILLLPSISFIPPGAVEEIKLELKLPEGTSITETKTRIKQIETIMRTIPQVNTVSTIIKPAEAEMFLKVNKKGERGRTNFDILIEHIRWQLSKFPEIKSKIAKIDKVTSAGGLGDPIELKVTGRNSTEIKLNSEKILEKLKPLPGIADLQIATPGLHTIGSAPEEFQVNIDKEKAAQLGLNSSYVASTVAGYLHGKTATKFGENLLNVRVIGREEDKQNLPGLLLSLPGRKTIPLNSIAEFSKAATEKEIERVDRQQVVSIDMNLKPGYALGEIIQQIKSTINRNLPQLENFYSIKGVAASTTESFSQLKYTLLVSIILIYLIMSAQFESFLYPFVIIFTLPLSTIGVIAGLRIANEPLTLPAMIGIIMLCGIVVNNGIILIDFVNILRQRGIPRTEAIIEAVKTRLQPVFITTLTTVLAMLPLALGIGAGAELYRSLAVVVVGGLLTSTLLTLVIIPLIYVLLEDVISYLRFLIIRLKTSSKFASN